jgi:hypothetical protein
MVILTSKKTVILTVFLSSSPAGIADKVGGVAGTTDLGTDVAGGDVENEVPLEPRVWGGEEGKNKGDEDAEDAAGPGGSTLDEVE